jgi:hypothetical protein
MWNFIVSNKEDVDGTGSERERRLAKAQEHLRNEKGLQMPRFWVSEVIDWSCHCHWLLGHDDWQCDTQDLLE